MQNLYLIFFNFQIQMTTKAKASLTLEETINHVRDFHDAFKLPVRTVPTGELSEKELTLRYNLMKEENEEYLEAAQKGDLVEIADALGDMLYILCGTINAHGLQNKIAEVFEEIQRSNMSKLDENGQPIYREDGKVMKSNRYFKPDVAGILASM
jgi:predicted HAD superfamily Cof-like phosphohydrolase